MGLSSEFADGWNGTIAVRCTIPQNGSTAVDSKVLHACFRSISSLPPAKRPRVILLSAHAEPAVQILQHAEAAGWQPHTIWISTDGWTGSRAAVRYQRVGIRPALNTGAVEFQAYLQKWRTAQQQAGQPLDELLCNYCAETVDALVALATALTAAYGAGATTADSLTNIANTTLVLKHLREVTFDGVSGSIAFDERGDRLTQKWEVMFAEPNVINWTTSEVFGVSPSSQNTWPSGPMGSVPADSYADWNHGSPDCPCIDSTAAVVGANSSAPCMSYSPDTGFDIDTICYQPSYGSNICAAHDSGLGPTCDSAAGTNPDFCGELWCYVDKEKCKGSTHSLHRSDMHLANDLHASLYFSYSTCGGSSAPWSQFRTTSSVAGKTLIFTVPILHHPFHFKIDAAGHKITAFESPPYFNDSMVWVGAVTDYLSAVVELSTIRAANFTWLSRGASKKFPSSVWTASVLDVQNGLSQVGASNFWVTAERLKMAPFTVPLYVDEVMLWIKNPVVDDSVGTKMWTVAAPFSDGLWVALGISTFIVAVFDVWYATPGEDFERWHTAFTGDEWKHAKCTRKFQVVLLAMGSMFCSTSMELFGGGVYESLNINQPQKVLNFGWGLVILIIIASCESCVYHNAT
jgi:hypothetical protein